MTVVPADPRKRRRRLLVNALGGLGVASLAALMWTRDPAAPSDPTTPVGESPDRRGSAARRELERAAEATGASAASQRFGETPPPGPASATTTTSPSTTLAAVTAAVPEAMKSWRLAILNQDADQVELLDRAFAEHPQAFTTALMTSAETDDEPRVRAFSTRVLGKLRPEGCRSLMRRLLADPSEYVRFNAAWAVGELGDREASAELHRLETRDRSAMVRRSASESLRKLAGG